MICKIIRKPFFIIALLLCLPLIGFAEDANSNITTANITFGELLMGEKPTAESMNGHIVAIVFWGIDAGSCSVNYPYMLKMKDYIEKYAYKELIAIGVNAQNSSKDKVYNFCKNNKVNFTMYLLLRVNGVMFKGSSYFCIFDTEGKLVFQGEPPEGYKKLDEIMKGIPDPLVGKGAYKKLKTLAQSVSDRKELGKVMKQLREKLAPADEGKKKDEEETKEAQELFDRLEKHAQKIKARAEKLRADSPLQYYELLKSLAAEFKGDTIGEETQNALSELDKDDNFQTALKSDKEWEAINKMADDLKPCKPDSPLDPKNCKECLAKNNNALQQIKTKGNQLLKKYPGTPAANKCTKLMDELG
jgi:hypothetical protein